MSQIPQIDWNDYTIEQLSLAHRTPRFISWFQGMINGGIVWVYINFWNYCFGDGISNLWSNGVTYSINDRVVTYFGTFISLKNNNVGNNPANETQDDINNPPVYWYKISPSYIGAEERKKYSAQKLTMEKALNRWFRTVFLNPTSLTDGTISGVWYLPKSQIWIQTKSFSFGSFGVARIGQPLGGISSKPGIYGFKSTSTGISDTTYEFIVWIPISLSILLGDSYSKIISEVVDKMSVLGTRYQIQTY